MYLLRHLKEIPNCVLKMLLRSNANFPCSNLLSNNYFLKVSKKSQPNLSLAMPIAAIE